MKSKLTGKWHSDGCALGRWNADCTFVLQALRELQLVQCRINYALALQNLYISTKIVCWIRACKMMVVRGRSFLKFRFQKNSSSLVHVCSYWSRYAQPLCLILINISLSKLTVIIKSERFCLKMNWHNSSLAKFQLQNVLATRLLIAKVGFVRRVKDV